MSTEFLLLTLNPGSTSTKIALSRNDEVIFTETLRHGAEELSPYPRVVDQYPFRKKVILEALEKEGISLASLSAVVGRGGVLKPVTSGTYLVNEAMLADVKGEKYGSHASNLGALIAFDLAQTLKIPAFVVDPVVVDEMDDLARITGMPGIARLSRFHALNQKAMARRAALDLGRSYEEVNLIVTHLGGGITVGAHLRGRVIDVNDALAGDGPFSPERCGRLPVSLFMELCYSNKFTKEEMTRKLTGQGGLVAHLGTNNGAEVEQRIAQGDEQARLIFQGLAYNIAKEIGGCGAVLKGQVDAVVITGGLAHSKMLVEWVKERVEFLAPVLIYPGEDEMEALAAGALRVLRGQEEAKEYSL